MALKRFNHEFSSISSGEPSYNTEVEAHLYCLLKETILNSSTDSFIDGLQDIPLALHNLHQVILKCDPKSGKKSLIAFFISGPFLQTVELIDEMISTLKDKENVVLNLPFLPVLTDILLQSPSRIENILKMIQDVSFGITIRTCHPFLERLIKFCVDLFCNEEVEHDLKIKVVALSVLINLCSKNAISLSLLEDQINFMSFQKKIPLDTYGVLTCKMNLVLDECGHILRDSDVRNFLKYTLKELNRMTLLDDKSLKHLVEFIRDLSERPSTKQLLQQYDFSLGIKSAIINLENSTDLTAIGVQINSLFEIIKIVMGTKNNSLNNLIMTITNYAIKRLTHPDCCIQAMEMLTIILETKISTNNLEMDEMQSVLNAILHSSDRKSSIMAPLFKLLNVLARHYKINLIKGQVVETIFAPILKLERTKYCKLPIGDITMYLECLTMLSTLMECQQFETKPNIFQHTNVRFLIAMSIKHGSTDQCCLALSLMNRFSKYEISKMISTNDNLYEISDAQLFLQNNRGAIGTDIKKEIGAERVKNVFFNIEKASLEDKIAAPTSDFIDLYTNEIANLKREIEIVSKKYEDISKEVEMAKGESVQLKITSLKWSELAQNLQRSNETLLAENEKLNTIVTSLRSKYSSVLAENDEAVRKLVHEKTIVTKKSKEMEEKVQSLEDELKDTEDMRQTILSLMSKRKKTTNKD